MLPAPRRLSFTQLQLGKFLQLTNFPTHKTHTGLPFCSYLKDVMDPDDEVTLVGRRPMQLSDVIDGRIGLPDDKMLVTAEHLAHAKYRGATAYALSTANVPNCQCPLSSFCFALAARV